MKIKTITCHNVYNYGASLQAYSLMKYLQNLGHDVEIIDYMPKYITDTLSLWAIGKKWNNNIIIKLAFYSYVVPVRLLNRKGRKKFDLFTKKYLNLTPRYKNFQDLCLNPPQADIYFTGSDQIWNTNIKNGLDPAFYLKFVPTNRISRLRPINACPFRRNISTRENRIKYFTKAKYNTKRSVSC